MVDLPKHTHDFCFNNQIWTRMYPCIPIYHFVKITTSWLLIMNFNLYKPFRVILCLTGATYTNRTYL